MAPETPKLPQRRRGQRSQQTNSATYAALLMLLGGGFALLMMVTMILPEARKLLLVVLGCGLFIAAHYFTWGRYMQRLKRQYDAEHPEESDSHWHAPPSPQVDESDE